MAARLEIFKEEIKGMMDQLLRGEDEIADWVRKSRSIESVIRLPGDASVRRYFRVRSDGVSYVVMKTEPFADDDEAYPFLAVQRALKERGVDVPEILDVDGARGYMLLEDLGDTTLLRRFQKVADTETERHLYERAIDALVHLQVEVTPSKLGRRLPGFDLRFDFEKLMWEVDFTIEHFYELHLKRKLREADRSVMRMGFAEICKTLADQPAVFTHRDFHSRNIMVKRQGDVDRLVMIDFQDARMGPPQYDLASLLKDSYYQIEEAQIARLIDYYVARVEAAGGPPIEREDFARVFDLMSVQRNFKAIGSFASFLNRRGDASYLKYIGNTFENIRRALLRYPRFSALREVLFHYYYF